MKTVKTGIDIIDETAKILIAASLPISGLVCKMQRPDNSKKEDVVVGVLALNALQTQEGVINVNIHVPDIDAGTLGYQPNLERFRALIPLVIDLFNERYEYDYFYRLDKPAEIIKDDNNSHFANIRLRYYSLRQDAS